MQHSFNLNSYLQHIAEELIRNFAFAGIATSPSLVGSAREKLQDINLEPYYRPWSAWNQDVSLTVTEI
jgi:hypothetical protein